jgi:minor extracellular protease Epr
VKRARWFLLGALVAAPLLAQVDGGPVRERPRGNGGGIGIGISLPIGKKKPNDTKLTGPALEMRDADIPDYVAGEVLFFLQGDAATAAKIARAAKVTIIEVTPLDALDEIMVLASIAPGDTVEAAVARLSKQKGVRSAQPNFQYQLLGNSRDKGFSLHGITISAKTSIAGTIVMIDSPIDVENAALKGAKIAQTIYANDKSGSAHGTAVAEILLGTGTFSGVARGANLVSLAAFEPAGEKSWLSTTAKLAKALNDATLRAPQVVNLSFGGNAEDKKLGDFLNAMEKKGVCVVAAAGNNGGTVRYPARAATVIATTAINSRKLAYGAASKGPEIDVAAWGVDINAAVPGGRRPVSGTSFATAVVSGSLLRLHGCNGGRSPAATRTYLTGAALDLGETGADNIYGAGLFRLKAKK